MRTKKGNGSPKPDEPGADPFQADRLRMVHEQIRGRGIDDGRVLAAMEEVPRHVFVAPGDQASAYNDNPLPIGFGQTISQPYIVALMTEALKIKPSDRVLEIGTGSGYQTSILARLARDVFTIECVESLAKDALQRLREFNCDNAHVRIGDGYDGWPEEAPFDGIIVTAAPESVPETLVDQLTVDGRMVIPVGAYYQELVLLTREGDGVRREKITDVRFVPMVRGKPA
jgi:protein-L-isoaspartate(D-aspartate) O-methyltransferase